MNVYKRPSGSWTASYRDPTTRKRRSKTFPTKRKAETWLHERHADIARGEHVSPNTVTVAEATNAWLDAIESSGSVRPSTLDAYRSDAQRHILPRIGDFTLAELNPGALEERLIQSMLRDGLAPPTIRRAFVPLSRALDRAVRHELIRANPARGIQWKEVLPKHAPPAKPTFTEAQLLRLIESAPDDDARTFIGLVCGHGLRIGEALGLRRKGLGERSIEVSQVHYKGRLGPPKTAASLRVVPTLPDFQVHLDEARQRCAGKPDDALVFSTMRGEALDASWAARRWLHPAQKAAGLSTTGWHALRRSYALLLDARGVSPIDARDLMGHANVAETQDSYQRSGTMEAQLERLTRALGAR